MLFPTIGAQVIEARRSIHGGSEIDAVLAAVIARTTARRNQAADLARSILMNMSEPKRMAFVLVELEGMSYGEAAASLNETFDAVRARVRAARAEFEHQVRLMEPLPGEVDHV